MKCIKIFKIATAIFFIPFVQRIEGKEVDISPTVAVVLIPCNLVEARVFH